LQLFVDPKTHYHEVGEANRLVAELVEIHRHEVSAEGRERVGDGLQLYVLFDSVLSEMAVMLWEAHLDESVILLSDVHEHHEA